MTTNTNTRIKKAVKTVKDGKMIKLKLTSIWRVSLRLTANYAIKTLNMKIMMILEFVVNVN